MQVIVEEGRQIDISLFIQGITNSKLKALFEILSRAKSAGFCKEDPDFDRHPNVLVSEGRLC